MKTRNWTQLCCVVVLSFIAGCASDAEHARHDNHYFISSSEGNDSNHGRSPSAPWRSLAVLNSLTLHPGDTIHLRAGNQFSGFVHIEESGSAAKPIVITSYGNGPLPRLTNPEWDFDRDGNVFRISGQHVVLENLHFADGVPHPHEDDKTKQQNIYEMGAVYLTPSSANVLVQYNRFENFPIGVQSQGKRNRIYQNYFHDCNQVLLPPHWGPIAIFVGGPRNEISYNYVRNYKGGGFGGFDGGAIEIDRLYFGGVGHGADHIEIHHNISIENAGFAEPEALAETPGHRFLDIHHNFSFDYKWFIEFYTIHDSTIRQNVAIRTLEFKSSNDGVLRLWGERYSVDENVFVVGLGRKVFREDDLRMLSSRNRNVYISVDGSQPYPIGLEPNRSDTVLLDASELPLPLFDQSGSIRKPLPDRNGIVTVSVPVAGGGSKEFSIRLPGVAEKEGEQR